MRRGVSSHMLALLLVLASCAPKPFAQSAGPDQAEFSPPVAGAVSCRVGPDGLPLPGTADFMPGPRTEMAERGIGGTGGGLTPLAPSPASPTRPLPSSGRGIGGTSGAPVPAAPGSLGIIGVITGFGSVCLAGAEIGLNDAPISADGVATTPAALRAGQLAVLTAMPVAETTSGARLGASRIDIRHEVSGPVEELRPDGRLVVAGQIVRITPQTWRPAAMPAPHPGQWLAVSGLRAPSGEIDATRLDPRAAGPVLVRGLLRRDGGPARIGTMPLEPGTGGQDVFAALPTDMTVSAEGEYRAGVLSVGRIAPDPVAANPVAFFAGLPDAPGHLLIEDDLAAAHEGLLLPGGGLFGPARSTGGRDATPRRGIVGYALNGTRYQPTRLDLPVLHPAQPAGARDMSAPGTDPGFMPAPTGHDRAGGPHVGGGRSGGRDEARREADRADFPGRGGASGGETRHDGMAPRDGPPLMPQGGMPGVMPGVIPGASAGGMPVPHGRP